MQREAQIYNCNIIIIIEIFFIHKYSHNYWHFIRRTSILSHSSFFCNCRYTRGSNITGFESGIRNLYSQTSIKNRLHHALPSITFESRNAIYHVGSPVGSIGAY